MFIKLKEKISNNILLIRVSDVMYVRANKDYSYIFCRGDATFSVEESADEILELLHKFGE